MVIFCLEFVFNTLFVRVCVCVNCVQSIIGPIFFPVPLVVWFKKKKHKS